MKVCLSLYFLFSFVALIFVCGCGVKGAPTPYVEAYPEKPNEVAQVQVTPSPSPSPSPDLKIKKTAPNKKKQK